MPLPERIETLSLPVYGVMQSLPTVFLPGISHVIVPADMIGRDRAEETLRSWSHLLPGEAMGLLLLAEDQTEVKIDDHFAKFEHVRNRPDL